MTARSRTTPNPERATSTSGSRILAESDGYDREESRAHQLDRNWAELVQELRVLGTGIQILFAFLLSVAFQARFAQTSPFQRDVYVATLALSGLSAALLIAPVAMHRILFRIRVKDELVVLTNLLALLGLVVLSLCLIGAVVLTSDWVSGPLAAWVCGAGAAVVFGVAWFALPIWLRRRAVMSMHQVDDSFGSALSTAAPHDSQGAG